MSNAEPLNLLIEKAASIVGSEYKLARALGYPPQTLTAWKAGRRTCTPSDRARLAGFARLDAVQELVRATIEQSKGVKREQLEKVLGKLSPQTGAVLHSAVLSLVSLTSGLWIFDIPRCIKSQFNNRRYTFC